MVRCYCCTRCHNCRREEPEVSGTFEDAEAEFRRSVEHEQRWAFWDKFEIRLGCIASGAKYHTELNQENLDIEITDMSQYSDGRFDPNKENVVFLTKYAGDKLFGVFKHEVTAQRAVQQPEDNDSEKNRSREGPLKPEEELQDLAQPFRGIRLSLPRENNFPSLFDVLCAYHVLFSSHKKHLQSRKGTYQVLGSHGVRSKGCIARQGCK